MFHQEITNSLGFNPYNLVVIDIGIVLKVARDELTYILVQVLALAEADDMVSEQVKSEEKPGILQNIKKKRFASVTPDDLDKIELNRNSSRTKIQTSWAVGIFKGIFAHALCVSPFKLFHCILIVE